MTNILKKIWNIVSTALVVLMVIGAVFLMGSRVMGYQPYNVLTGSMSPTYKVDDLIFVKEVYKKDFNSITDPVELEIAKQEKIQNVKDWINNGTLKVGDSVTFVKDENLTVATHRIVEIDTEKNEFITKGDANKEKDSPISFLNLIGEVQFSIPKLGRVSTYIQTHPGMYITLGLGAVLIIFVFFPDIIGKKRKEKTEEINDSKTTIDVLDEENKALKAELERLRLEMEDNKSE